MMKNRIAKSLVLVIFFTIIFSCSDSEEAEALTLSAGDYKGTWNSSTATATFNNIAISARVTEVSTGKFEGTFYISSNFTACCGGGNDGTIDFTVSGENITDFVWDDTIPNCTGTFSGTGVITSQNNFRINFTGMDCDGSHTGYLTMSRSK